jgi:hypothetical protein
MYGLIDDALNKFFLSLIQFTDVINTYSVVQTKVATEDYVEEEENKDEVVKASVPKKGE